MDFKTCVKSRRSVRRFTEAKLSHDDFKEIVDLARYAPSWKNSQTVRYTLVQNPDILADIANNAVLDFSYNTKTILKAANLVILSSITHKSGYEEDGTSTTSKDGGWEMFDAGIAAQTFCLSAYEYGYGTVIMGIFDDEKIGKIIALPEGQTVSAIIAIGIPKLVPEMPQRLEVDELVTIK